MQGAAGDLAAVIPSRSRFEDVILLGNTLLFTAAGKARLLNTMGLNMRICSRLQFANLANIVTAILTIWPAVALCADDMSNNAELLQDRSLRIERLLAQRKGGQAYRLIYWVDLPVEVYWKFKTDFDNTFLVENKNIRNHRFVSRDNNTVVTENRYARGPDVFYRWQTTLFPELHRLDFHLLNAEQCHQKYHHGSIQIESHAGGTLITQVAYFDFWGASLWVLYPWRGGMRDFLTYTARWEQATALRLRARYHD
jgi:hypothetical protein